MTNNSYMTEEYIAALGVANYILADHLVKKLEEAGVLTHGQVEELYDDAARTAAETASAPGGTPAVQRILVEAAAILRAYIA